MMSRSSVFGALGLALVLAGVAGCSSKKAAIYEHENFDDSGTFSRSFPVTDAGSCEAARRALLSQGYVVSRAETRLVQGAKRFQPEGEVHVELAFTVVCVPAGRSGSTIHSVRPITQGATALPMPMRTPCHCI